MVPTFLIRGRDLIAVARSLVGNEPRHRSAVSRAYYAAFSEVTAYIVRQGYVRTGTNPHDRAWNHLKAGVPDADVQRAATRRAAADTGFRLKERRHKADYSLSQTVSAGEMTDAVSEAEAIVRAIDRLDAGRP